MRSLEKFQEDQNIPENENDKSISILHFWIDETVVRSF